jgi:hypothetical protein
MIISQDIEDLGLFLFSGVWIIFYNHVSILFQIKRIKVYAFQDITFRSMSIPLIIYSIACN